MEFDYDVIVIGSGFGGSVSALRLAEKGYRVHVLEAGARREDHQFARTSWDVRNYLWAPKLKCFGVQRIHKIPHAIVLAGAGVGGGSLNYANTLYVPGDAFFKDAQWAHIADWRTELEPHFATAKRMLGVVTNPCDGPIEFLMKDVANNLGVGESFAKTPVGVFFGAPGKRVDDPYFDGAGPARTGCTECGNCMVGCRVGAKNTLLKNYLYLAEKRGATISAMRTVTVIEPLDATGSPSTMSHGENGWRITTEHTGAWVKRDTRTMTARYVIMAAGTWGTQSLLHAMKRTTMPELPPALGRLTRTNSEELGGACTIEVPRDVDLTKGVAITSSFYVDDVTHVENVRYGKGSNAMGFFSTLLVPGDVPNKLSAFARALRESPRGTLKAMIPAGWSERTVIALVMQSVDNSLIVSPKRVLGRWVLTSEQGHGAPNPDWIEGGHRAIRAMTKRLSEITGTTAVPGMTWNELFGIPMTAHFLGGAAISDTPEHGVIDPFHRIWGYPSMSVVDGAAISANPGVNPSLTITAQAERAMSLWPRNGELDERPPQPERVAPAVLAAGSVASGART